MLHSYRVRPAKSFIASTKKAKAREGPRGPLRELLVTLIVFASFLSFLLKNLPSLRPNHVNRPGTDRRPRITYLILPDKIRKFLRRGGIACGGANFPDGSPVPLLGPTWYHPWPLCKHLTLHSFPSSF